MGELQGCWGIKTEPEACTRGVIIVVMHGFAELKKRIRLSLYFEITVN